MKDLLRVIDENDLSCFNSYKRIAETLMNNYKIRVKEKWYRIIDCEFYFSSTNHEDPFVHGSKRQKESCGEWYFHGSGLDITIAQDNGFGGILIRGIAEVKRENHIPLRGDETIGPLNVCREFFEHFGSALTGEPILFGLVEISRDKMGASMKEATIFAVPRIGLNAKNDKNGKYLKMPYRFISFLNLAHREADKVKRYLTSEAENPIDISLYKDYYSAVKW